ncbi:hypothetical protein BaRGS_00019605 [Batillaria attramentaria]|uniref:Uncharacterized protein n=1 Tax=Batillaria attramentaria TaxID=370345 RepID=A0ABD0KPN6_9CAEN
MAHSHVHQSNGRTLRNIALSPNPAAQYTLRNIQIQRRRRPFPGGKRKTLQSPYISSKRRNVKQKLPRYRLETSPFAKDRVPASTSSSCCTWHEVCGQRCSFSQEAICLFMPDSHPPTAWRCSATSPSVEALRAGGNRNQEGRHDVYRSCTDCRNKFFFNAK